MATFRDAGGEEWRVRVTFADLEDAAALGADLESAIRDPAALHKFLAETPPAKFAALLWHFCRDQAAERKLDARAFKARLDGGAVRGFVTALLEEAVNFSPLSPLTGGGMGEVIGAVRAAGARDLQSHLASLRSGGGSPGTSASPTSGP